MKHIKTVFGVALLAASVSLGAASDVVAADGRAASGAATVTADGNAVNTAGATREDSDNNSVLGGPRERSDNSSALGGPRERSDNNSALGGPRGRSDNNSVLGGPSGRSDNSSVLGAPRERSDDSSALEAQLEAARAELERAAHQVAELSSQLSRPLVEKYLTLSGQGAHHAVIGVQLDVNSGNDGARVAEVSPGGPAAEAGLQAGDVIVSVNGTDVKGDDTARQVMRLMQDVAPDSKVKVRVQRAGKPHDFIVVARQGVWSRDLHDLPRLHEPPGFALQGPQLAPPLLIRGALADMELVTLTPQLGRYFGTEKGVLVVRAPREGGFKLEDGDVILAIDGREPTSSSHATRILGSYQPGEKVTIRLLREHKTLNVETTLPDRGERAGDLGHHVQRAYAYREEPPK